MAMGSAPSGGMTVRWIHGVFLTLCVALAVLVHHETFAMDAPSVPHMVPATHAMPDRTAPVVSNDSSHGADDDGGCSTPGMQHCTTASVDSVQLAAPTRVGFDPSANLRQAAAAVSVPDATVGRAPPDLSVLSQLRI
ncbi:hypothetical protein QFZ22_009386 [Streptomyces canus]|uniref:Secreted protein n=1 Tax=Streptomyces canus TaxID=58343 RepID=A0AAW8FTI8_9ACTN|nr:DUF6153 family protein [Streptomyces canus]MDQ0913401.1 hypothetical protein [Streptomyces canus]